MPTAIQILGAIIGILLTAQLTQLLSAVKGMRTDIHGVLVRLEAEAQARHKLAERVLVLETEHKANMANCRHKVGA